MSLLDTVHKRKSFTLTSILLAILIVMLFYVGLTYLDPPPESGISVNFGTTNEGSGKIQPREKIRTAPKPIEQPKEEVKQEVVASPQEKTEEVLTNDAEEAPVIPTKKETPKTNKETTKPAEEVKKPVEKPKPSKSTTDALSSILNGPKNDGTKSGGEGPDGTSGDKGDPKGDPYATSYYGGPGRGTGGVGYGLNGRGKPTFSITPQECNEAGRVVVQIKVNQEGRVIQANPGVRGTTNNHPCLLDAAKRNAMSFRWRSDSKAPSSQIGFIELNFKLGE
ncbi:energy transducer TonB [Ascidiimonas sp. W6]|uniref:energy transducer TonB n=1 Tax=Ascidiimonas meishanensis TaxID=3128903 RepID=UPI0030EDFB4F